MSTPQEREANAQFALSELKQRTDLLRKVKGNSILKTVGILASLAWLPILFLGRDRAVPAYFVIAVVAAIIIVSIYIQLTNRRIDELIKLIGEDKLSKKEQR